MTTGIGTTVSTMVNQWVIKQIQETEVFLARVFLALISPFIFFITNVTGYLADLSPDKRFATRFHVIFKKRQ